MVHFLGTASTAGDQQTRMYFVEYYDGTYYIVEEQPPVRNPRKHSTPPIPLAVVRAESRRAGRPELTARSVVNPPLDKRLARECVRVRRFRQPVLRVQVHRGQRA